jgi:hypothetical protein
LFDDWTIRPGRFTMNPPELQACKTGGREAPMPAKGKGSGKARSALSGRYVTKKYAKANPGKTVVEHDKGKGSKKR